MNVSTEMMLPGLAMRSSIIWNSLLASLTDPEGVDISKLALSSVRLPKLSLVSTSLPERVIALTAASSQKWWIEDILKSGYDFTVLDDQSVAAAKIKDGKLMIGLGGYSVVVMPHVSVTSLEALSKLADFKAAGGKIIWLDCTPSLCSDQRDAEEYKAVLKKLGAKVTADLKELSKLCKIPMNARPKSGVFITEYKREDDGKRIVYLANCTNSVKTVNLGDGCGKYYIYDPYDCTVKEAEGQSTVAVPKYRAILIVN